MFINMELYRAFYIAAMEGSLSRAANKLYISQPAVSQAVKQLEERLGEQLFFREPKGIRLTPGGELLFKYVEPAFNFIGTAERKFAEMQNLLSGEINIGASDMTCKYYLLPYLEQFHKQYPGVKIHVTNGPTPETIGLLKKGMIDLGIISLPIEDDERLKVTEVMDINDSFIAGDNYIQLKGRKISIDELLKYPILLLEKQTTTRKYIDTFFREKGYDIQPEIELATSDLLVQFAKKGLGISCVVKNFAEEELDNGNLFEIKLNDQIPPRKIGIITLSNVPFSPAGRKFLNILSISGL